jgi:hypothetical protein
MLIGYIWSRWSAKDLGELQRLADYGAAHDWQMGLPASQPEVYLGDNLKGLLCRAIYALSAGDDARECRKTPAAFFPVPSDYEQHIQVLAILLQGEIEGSTNKASASLVAALAALHPQDGLFQTARGIYFGTFEPAIALMLDPGYDCPPYVRGAPAYCLAHRAFVLKLLLDHTN